MKTNLSIEAAIDFEVRVIWEENLAGTLPAITR